tara:strand:+ start:4985 stop:6382 length:1398 start_codon:yes stop_codon:yes gene_type:complete
MINNYINKYRLIFSSFLFFILICITFVVDANASIEKCENYSQRGLHEPAINHCNTVLDNKKSSDVEANKALYYLGNSYFSLDKLDKALESFSSLIKNDKNYPEAYYLKGAVLLRQGNPKLAKENFENALLLNYTSKQLSRLYAKSLLQSNNKKEAILNLTELTLIEPKDIILLTELSKAYLSIENYSKASEKIDRVIFLNNNYANAYFIRSQIKSLQGDNKEALEDITRALRIENNNNRYLIKKTNILMQLNNYQMAEYNIKKVLHADPNNYSAKKIYENLLKIKAEMSIKQAREFVANKNYLEANEEYSNAIKLDTSNSYAYFERSQIYYALKKYELALNDINIAEELNKSFSDHSINFIKGKILFNIGNIEDSIKSFEKEIKYKPENVIGILWQIRALSKYKEYDRAKIYAEKLIKIDPNSARSYSILGDILLFMGELEESDKYHALALKLDPNYKIATKTFN